MIIQDQWWWWWFIWQMCVCGLVMIQLRKLSFLPCFCLLSIKGEKLTSRVTVIIWAWANQINFMSVLFAFSPNVFLTSQTTTGGDKDEVKWRSFTHATHTTQPSLTSANKLEWDCYRCRSSFLVLFLCSQSANKCESNTFNIIINECRMSSEKSERGSGFYEDIPSPTCL
jgi:hypothetical protein